MPSAAISQGAAGTTHIVPDASVPAGRLVRVKALWGSMSAAGTIKFQSSDGTALTGVTNVALSQTVVLADSGAKSDGWFETKPGQGVDVVSVTGAFNGSLVYQFA